MAVSKKFNKPASARPLPAVTAAAPTVTTPTVTTPAVTAPTVTAPTVTAPVAAAPAAAPVVKAAAPEAPVAAASAVESMLAFTALPDALRANAEQGIESLRAQYAAFKGNAAAYSDKIEESLTAAQSGARVFNGKVLDVFRANIDAGFAHLNALFNVSTLSEALKLQQDFHKQQAETLQAQVQDLADYAKQVAGQVAEPVKSSITLPFQAA